MTKIIINSFVSLLIIVMVGCAEPPVPILYKANVQQGNILSSEMVRNLRIGMSKDTVLDVIGSPVLCDTFNSDRWSYVYVYKPGKAKVKPIEKHLVLYFRNNRLIRIDSNGNLDEVPVV